MRGANLLTIADFYLEIAQQELKQLQGCPGPIILGDDGYSEHFRHAVITTVFSALAVEYAITELIWIECFLRTPAPHRNKTLQLAEMLRNVPDKLKFLQNSGLLPSELVNEVSKLFKRRNRLVHLRNQEVVSHSGGVISVEDVMYLNQQGRGSELDSAIKSVLAGNPKAIRNLANEVGKPQTSITLPGLSTEIVSEAPENLSIAERALAELRQGWNTRKPRRISKRGTRNR